MPKKKHINILCSGVALGVYTPGLLLSRNIDLLGYDSEIYTIESLFFTEKQEKILQNKFAFHRDFRIALKGQKIAGDIRPNFDPNLVEKLIKEWQNSNENNFVVFSGYWLPIIDQYINVLNNSKCNIYLCSMDSTISKSWGSYSLDKEYYKFIWLFEWEKQRINYYINIEDLPVIPFKNRNKRFFLHGGGWGMGTYREKIPELLDQGFNLDIMVYEKSDIVDFKNKEYYMIDPSWRTWEKNSQGSYIFPPFGKVNEDGSVTFSSNNDYHDSLKISGNSLGVISKPGGGTLLDSLNTATPLIFLEPFGEHEEKNRMLWENLGLGIHYNNWKKNNYSIAILQELHDNLIKIKREAKNLAYEII